MTTGEGGPGDTGGSGCEDGAAATSLICDPLRKIPKTIKETGFFPKAPDFAQHSARMRKFVPDPPLWSDGMEKERFLLLPVGKKIDNTDPKKWAFPVGTILIKTFFDDTGPGGKPRPIETRLIRRVGAEGDLIEYDFYLYKWNPQSTDADLILDDRNTPDEQSAEVMVTINHAPLMVNNGQAFAHTLPSRGMCKECHEGNGLEFQTFIGFDEIRLGTIKLAGSDKTQLQLFQEADIFVNKAKPGDPPPRSIPTTDALLAKAEHFILGNCVHCHNQKGMVFDMSPENFAKNTIGMKTNAQSVEPPPTWRRILPGNPDESVVYRQAKRLGLPPATGMNKLRPMPPYGVNDNAADLQGLEDLRKWICALPGGPKVPLPACKP